MDYYDEFYDAEDDCFEIDGDELDFSLGKTKSLRPYHLNAALTPHWFNALRNREGDRKMLGSLRDMESACSFNIENAIWSPIQFYLLIGSLAVLVDPCCYEQDALDVINTLDLAEQTTWQGATESINIQVRSGIADAIQTVGYKIYNLQANMFSFIVLLMNAMSSGRNFPNRTEKIVRLAERAFVVSLQNGHSMYVTENLVTATVAGKSYIMNYDSMLMCSDLAKQRRLTMGMTHLGNKLFPENYPTQEKLAELFSIFDDGMLTHGNGFYRVIKTFEPLCVGAIMKTEFDHFVDNDEFFNTMFESLHEEAPEYDYYVNKATEFLTSEKNPRWLAQYFGLYRIWGHPIVDVTAGIKKVMDIGLKVTYVNDHTTLEAERHFKWIFLSNYKKRNHVYPNVTVLYKEDSWLVSQIRANRDLPNPGSLWYLHELDCIDFAEVFRPPATFNLTSIIADKAVSPSRTELKELIKKGKNSDAEIRRGVLKWLNQDNVSCKEILKMVDKNEFPDDWCIIGVYPKEREENIKPRLFALMSFELRIYVVVTEEMLSDNILEYFPQITMTSSQLDLTKNIFTATRHQSTDYSKKNSNLVTVSLSMDFEKWNIMMRKEATFRVFRQLGLLFGMEHLFTATHDILSRCFIYLADGSYFPHPDLLPDFIHSWTNHLGGFEGLRQKGWTIFTACLIDYVCSRRDVKFKLMGQGDNQVVQLIFRLNHTMKNSGGYHQKDIDRIRKAIEEVINDLDETFKSVGMRLKISETWKSSHLFSYGKNMVFNGVPMPLSLKKGARSFYESNEGIMVLDSMMATISTNCQAAAYQDVSHHIAYHWARYESYIMTRKVMDYHPLLGTGLKHYNGRKWSTKGMELDPPMRYPDDKYLAGAMISVPRMMGGFNTTCLFEYIMRGFPDPLTRDLCYLKMLCEGLERVQSSTAKGLFEVIYPWYVFIPNGSVDRSFLIQDPLALNLFGPRSPMDAMRAAVENLLQRTPIKNKPFKELIQLKSKTAVSQIADLLWTAERINSRLGHDIYEATPYGYVTQSLARIENANTVKQIAFRSSKKDIIEVIGESEVNKYLYFCWKSCNDDLENYQGLKTLCTRVYADRARAITWRKEVVGATVPFPDEYLEMHREAKKISSSDDEGYFIVGFNEHSVRNRETLLSTLGPSPPYLGSVTREKTKQTADASVFKAESLLRRPLKLQRAIGWFIPQESNMADLIHQTLSCVCDLTPEEFETTDWESTGSHIHRYHDTVTKKGVLINYSYLPGTHMYLSSDLLVKYSQSKANVNIVYQACLVYQQYLAWILQLEAVTRGSGHIRALTWKIKCECIQEVDEGFDDISVPPEQLLPKQIGNELLWVSKEELIIHHSARLQMVKSTTPAAIEDFSQEELIDFFHIMVAKRIAADIFSGELSEDVEAKMVDSVGRYPRVYYGKLKLPKLLSAVIIWIKAFLVRRLGPIGTNIRGLLQLENDIGSKLESASPLQYQGLGLFFTNRNFVEKHLQNPLFPRPDTYPYTLRSVSKAMKEYTLNFYNARKRIKLLTSTFLPIEFSNLQEETINTLLFRAVAQPNLCVRCLEEITNWSVKGAQRRCSDHKWKRDLMTDGKLTMRYIPVTTDRLSKLATPLVHKISPRSHGLNTELIPKSRLLLSNIKNMTRTGGDSSVHMHSSDTCVKMGSLWQKYCRAAAFPTASRYKWTVMLNEAAKKLSHRSIVVFGDGLGGVSDLCNIFWPASKITIVSYLDVSDAINHSTIGCTPPEYQGDTEMLDVYYQANVVNDVLSPAFVDQWHDQGDQFELLVSDVELSRDCTGSEYVSYITNLTSIRPHSAIIKVYIRSPQLLINILGIVCSRFDFVDLHTCATANLHFNEVFLLCSGRSRNTNCWLFSARSLESQINQMLASNGPDTWNQDREVRMLEKMPWIEGLYLRSHKLMYNWFAQSGLEPLIELDTLTVKELHSHTRRLLNKYRRKRFGLKKKVPYIQLLQVAQRLIAVALIHCDDLTILRKVLNDPSTIQINICNDINMESISFNVVGEPGSNSANWGYAMKYVAICRRARGLGI